MLLKSAQKTFIILEILCEEGEKGLSELARRLTLGKSNVHRHLSTLVDLGYVEKNPETNRYLPTVKTFEIGTAIISRMDLYAIARPFLSKLSTESHETAFLATLNRGEVVYIDKVESPESLITNISIGSRVPAYCTALGKALLANRDKSELMELLQVQKLLPYTLKTITSWKLFRDHLLKVREQGYAVDDEEFIEGVRCIAAPIKNYKGRVVGAVSIAGPSLRMSFEKIDQLKDLLLNTTRNMSKKLGN